MLRCLFKSPWPALVLRRLVVLVGLVLLTGCIHQDVTPGRPFRFPADTLSLTNETAWVYARDPVTGEQRHTPRQPPPTYALRCFVVARTAKQFHAHAEFRPELPAVTAREYRRHLRAVLARSPRRRSEPAQRVVIPGFADLHSFSAAWVELFQAEAGGAWLSYAQRGNWRMVLPFSRRGQRNEAQQLAAAIKAGRAPVVHVVDFPHLRINHALLPYAVTETDAGLHFLAYDPNQPGTPLELSFDRARRRFQLAATAYYIGGDVNAYTVYDRAWR
jgi:hypothetical protein